MAYKLRDDLVLEVVSGAHIIVALRSAWKDCPFALHTSASSALIFSGMKEGLSKDEILSKLHTERSMPMDRAELMYNSFVKYGIRHNYFLPEEPS